MASWNQIGTGVGGDGHIDLAERSTLPISVAPSLLSGTGPQGFQKARMNGCDPAARTPPSLSIPMTMRENTTGIFTPLPHMCRLTPPNNTDSTPTRAREHQRRRYILLVRCFGVA